ncbi:uncharacterized protein Triagg1_5261 [Trichoderma aggressivum f. europaeum]|uniref:Uncharacterized protein n=1 Tax=Trichoderma aggressivum f. europaeum TaxID=173218 RepID=A0AAE1LYN8_9HYPO|nr:hypothetical protein Triagg1_5261 [Trichoderma aggressivum f. europaeum]
MQLGRDVPRQERKRDRSLIDRPLPVSRSGTGTKTSERCTTTSQDAGIAGCSREEEDDKKKEGRKQQEEATRHEADAKGIGMQHGRGACRSYLMVATTMVVLLMRFLDEEGGLTTEGKMEAEMPCRSACRGEGGCEDEVLMLRIEALEFWS